MSLESVPVHFWIASVALAISAVAWLVREVRSRAAQSWPVVDGTVESAAVRIESRGTSQVPVAEVRYSYRVEGEFYSGAHLVASEGELGLFSKGSRVVVHFKVSDPSVSFLDRDDLRARREHLVTTL